MIIRQSTFSTVYVLVTLLATQAAAIVQQYCSSLNTGASSNAISNQFNSNGKCQDSCPGFAFAVVQGQNCWCSNYAPAKTLDILECGVACPGYPFENCGDESKGHFGYVALGPAPSGTQGSGEETAVVTNVVTQAATRTITPPSSNPASTTTSTTSSSTWTPVPIMSILTVTGMVKTLTITPTAPPTSTQTIVEADNSSRSTASTFFSSPGKVAGTFVAVGLVVVVALALGVYLCLRRRHDDQSPPPNAPSTNVLGTPQRRPSRMSQLGLLGRSPPETGSQNSRHGLITPDEKSYPKVQTTEWDRSPDSALSRHGSDNSPADTFGSRISYPPIVDQRLEPTAVWNPLHDNGSHVSLRSFRDDQDYSRRMLRVANPDEK